MHALKPISGVPRRTRTRQPPVLRNIGRVIMQEVFAIVVALTALILGLLVVGWASGDFE